MHVIESVSDAFIKKAARKALLYVGEITDSIEIRMSNEDYVIIEDTKIVVSIGIDSPLVATRDEDGMFIHVARKILMLRHSGPLAGLLADRELIRLGHAKELFRYYYSLLSRRNRAAGAEDFMEMNLSWISLWPQERESAEFLRKMAIESAGERDIRLYDRLFSMLKKPLYSEAQLRRAEEEWMRVISSDRINPEDMRREVQ